MEFPSLPKSKLNELIKDGIISESCLFIQQPLIDTSFVNSKQILKKRKKGEVNGVFSKQGKSQHIEGFANSFRVSFLSH